MIWTAAFYAFAAIFIYKEIRILTRPIHHVQMRVTIDRKAKIKQEELTIPELRIVATGFLYLVWVVLGAFGSQSFLFVGFFLFSLIIFRTYRNINLKYAPLLFVVDSLISILLMGFILYNRFFLHLKMTF